MDINAAVSSAQGATELKIRELDNYGQSDLYTDAEKVALSYADAMTLTDEDVSDALFNRLSAHYSQEMIVEITAVIAWENASSKFNRALRVESQELWQP